MRTVYASYTKRATRVPWAIPVRRGRGSLIIAGLVDALDADDSGDFTNVGEDSFKLAAIDNFEAGIDTGVIVIRAAFEIANIRAGSADDSGNVRKQACAVLGANGELNRERGGGLPAPLDGDTTLSFVEQILHVGAELGVNRDAAAPRDITRDVIARNRIAALGTKNEQAIVTFDDKRRVAHAKYAFDGFDDSRLGVVGVRVRRLRAFAEDFGNNLACGIFTEANGSV